MCSSCPPCPFSLFSPNVQRSSIPFLSFFFSHTPTTTTTSPYLSHFQKKMYEKATCIAFQTAATCLALQAPKSSTNTETADKVKKDSLLVASYAHLVSPLGQSIVISASTLYIVLLHRGIIPPHLKTWQLITTISSVLAVALRYWAFKTLGRLFTVCFILWDRLYTPCFLALRRHAISFFPTPVSL